MGETNAKPSKTYTLHLVSDLTGGLASHMITAILTQFPDIQFKQQHHTFRDTPEKIRNTVQKFAKRRTIVFHALVDPDNKAAVHEACERLKIPHFDLTGSLVQFLSDHLGVPPAHERSRLHRVDEGYFKRIEAMEFTQQHDDGRNLGTLKQAEIILLGLSRVSKSPSATYLGSLGYKTANVSITPETGFPRELTGVKKKIVALTIQPARLQQVRERRLLELGAGSLPYADMQAVIREVVWAEGEYTKRGYPVLDVTGMTIETTAAEVLARLGKRRISKLM